MRKGFCNFWINIDRKDNDMKKNIITAIALCLTFVSVAAPGKIKAKWFEANISPDVGALIAGYVILGELR